MSSSPLRGAVAVALFAWALAVPAASAHQGNPNYRSTVTGLVPAVPGLAVSILNFDDRVLLINRTGRTVVVRGYDNEPYVRFLGDGTVEVNKRSSAYYLNADRLGASPVPPDAQPGATPQWTVVDKAGRYEWHDHRIHWMGKTDPVQVKDRGKRTKIFDWRLPVTAGATASAITGTLYWQPRPEGGVPAGAMVALAVLALGGLGLVVVVKRRRGARGPVSADPAGHPADRDGDGGPREAW